jgi:hypothetical protein
MDLVNICHRYKNLNDMSSTLINIKMELPNAERACFQGKWTLVQHGQRIDRYDIFYE